VVESFDPGRGVAEWGSCCFVGLRNGPGGYVREKGACFLEYEPAERDGDTPPSDTKGSSDGREISNPLQLTARVGGREGQRCRAGGGELWVMAVGRRWSG
jgi:hypothetical protein